MLVAHTLRGEGHDASKDGTGRGVPIVSFQSNLGSRGGDVDVDRSPPVRTGSGKGGNPPAVAFPIDLSKIRESTATGAGTPATGIGNAGDPAYTLGVQTAVQAVAFDARQSDVLQYGDHSGPFDTDGHSIGVQAGMALRRLTPRECERLQGFPDDWTAVMFRGKPAADGPRYRAIGNSMAVPVIRWLGRRIEEVTR